MSTLSKKIATLLLSILMVFVATIPAELLTKRTPVAHAEAVTVVGGAGSIAEKVAAAAAQIIAGGTQALVLKEYTLDGIAYMAARLVVQQLVRSTLSWINSGFQGSPAFVTDLGGYLMNIADETAGEIIYGSDLGFLCRPINVRIALAIQYQQRNDLKRQVQCTLSGVVNNVDGFLSGNFDDGGWPGWFELFLNPQNNTIGGIATAQVFLDNEILRRQQIAGTKLNWGEGLLSWEECPAGSDSGGTAAVAGARDVAHALVCPDGNCVGGDGMFDNLPTPTSVDNSDQYQGTDYYSGSNPGETGGQPNVYAPTSDTGGAVSTEPGGGTVTTGPRSGGGGGGGSIPAASGGVTNTTSGGTTSGSPTAGGTPGCRIVTPGSLIADQLKFNFQTGGRALIEADELNEIISALLSQLVTQAFQGVGGMLGLSQSYGGSPSYLDSIGSEVYDTYEGEYENSFVIVGQAVAGEEAFQRIWQRVVTRADGVISSVAAAGTCTINAPILSQATAIRNAATALINESIVTVALLEDIDERYNAATTGMERSEIVAEFGDLQNSGVLNTTITNITAEEDANDDMDLLDDLTQNIEPCPPPDPNDPNAIQSVGSLDLAMNQPLYGFNLFGDGPEGVILEDTASGGLQNVSLDILNRLSEAGKSCRLLMLDAMEIALKEDDEEAFVFFKDLNGQRRLGRVGKNRTPYSVRVDESLVDEAKTLGTDLYVMHTHPFDVRTIPEPSGTDYRNSCILKEPSAVLSARTDLIYSIIPSQSCRVSSNANLIAIDKGSVAGYVLSSNPDDRPRFIDYVKKKISEGGWGLATLSASEKQEMLEYVESLRNLTEAQLGNLRNSHLASVGLQFKAQTEEEFCADKQNGNPV